MTAGVEKNVGAGRVQEHCIEGEVLLPAPDILF